jgi:hypothetical protein
MTKNTASALAIIELMLFLCLFIQIKVENEVLAHAAAILWLNL